MNKNKCVICASNKYKILFEKDSCSVMSCKKCGLVKTIQNANIDYSTYHRDTDYYKFESHFKNIFRKRYLLVNKFTKGYSKVCDIGSSTGTMLDIFAAAGWETWGVEPSKSARVAKEKGHKIIQNTLEQAKLPSNYFDAVVLNHTLEHVSNPVLVLKKTKQILKKDGIVLVDVPNFGGLAAQKLKKNWPLLLPAEHTYQFTVASLGKVFEKAGFKVIHHESRSGIFEFANPLQEIFESLFSFKKRFFENIFGLPGAIISTYLDKGSSLTMIGRKP